MKNNEDKEMKGQCLGGKMTYKMLNLGLQKESPINFDRVKGVVIRKMIEEYMIPIRWYKVTKKGCGVKFDAINTKEDIERAKAAYKEFEQKMLEKWGKEKFLDITKEDAEIITRYVQNLV